MTVLYARVGAEDGTVVLCAWTTCRGRLGTLTPAAPGGLQFTVARGYIKAGDRDGVPFFDLTRTAARRMRQWYRSPVLTRRDEVAFAPMRLPAWIRCPECGAINLLDGEQLGDAEMMAVQKVFMPRQTSA